MRREVYALVYYEFGSTEPSLISLHATEAGAEAWRAAQQNDWSVTLGVESWEVKQ
jgi:hypothetical protein